MRRRSMYAMPWMMMWARRMGRGPHMMGCGPHEFSVDDELAFLEEYQRDLEQEVADVATRIRELREAHDRESSRP